MEDLRALNLARPRGLNAVADCAGALQANASAHRQARSASSTSQSDRIEEPSSQSTVVHASPLVGLDTCVCTGTQPSIAAPKIDEEFATAYYTPKKRQEQLQAESLRPRPSRLQALTMVQPQSIALPGLNVQWPWSRLILAGVKDEIRTYDLGARNICRANQETWIVETPGDKVAAEDIAVLDGVNVGHRPEVAQIIGTVTFSRAEQYANIDEFRGDAARHRIRAGCRFDWDGIGKRYVWRVLHTRKILDPIEQPGRKSTTGFNRPRACTVTFFRAAEPEPSRAKRIRCCPKTKSVLQAVAAQRQRLADEANASDAVVLERRALESGLASIALAMNMPVFERRTDDLKELRAIKERRLQELRACDNEQPDLVMYLEAKDCPKTRP